MRSPKLKILEHIGDCKRVTHYHLTNKRNINAKEGGASKLRNITVHITGLEKAGYVRKADQGIIREGRYRTQYYELTRKGSEKVGIQNSCDFPIKYPSEEHQYGLQTAVTAVYLTRGERATIEYAPKKTKYGYHLDALLHYHDRSYIVEFERSKGLLELANEIRTRDKLLNFKKLCDGSKILYVINCTKNKNKESLNTKSVNPIYLYDEVNEAEKRVEQFLNELLNELKDLPSWKYRFACLHEFEQFGEGIWRAPGKKETFKIN